MVANLDENVAWRKAPLLTALEVILHRHALDIEQDRRGGILVIGRRTLSPFGQEDYQIYSQLHAQVSLGAQNLDLLIETAGGCVRWICCLSSPEN